MLVIWLVKAVSALVILIVEALNRYKTLNNSAKPGAKYSSRLLCLYLVVNHYYIHD